MENPFSLSNEDLRTLLRAYTEWYKKSGDEKYIQEQRAREDSIKKTFLDDIYLAKTSDESLASKLFEYTRTLEGPAIIRIGETRVKEELESIRRSLKFIIESSDDPFQKAGRILEGDLRLPIFAKAFWTPILQARYPEILPNWNNKTVRFMKKVGVDIATSKLSREKKYRLLSAAFRYLLDLDDSQDFYTINHLMHYGTVIQEGSQLLNELLSPGSRYWQIAPGEGARLWDDFLAESIAAVGWNEIDVDLNGISRGDLEKEFKDKYPGATEMEMKFGVTQLMNFIKLRPGDRIVTNKGKSVLLGVGVVKSGYSYKPDRKEYRHTVGVEYYHVNKGEVSIPDDLKGKFGKTILRLTEPEFRRLEALFEPQGKNCAWIFQGNPKYFDIDAAITSLKEMTWEINQHKDEVHAGDTAYVWRSGQDAGVLAVAKIVDEPKQREMIAAEKVYIRDPKWFTEKTLRATIIFENVLNTPILRSTLLEHPLLSTISILRAPQGSIFKLEPGEVVSLQQLINKRRGLNLEYPISKCAEDTGFGKELNERWVRAIERKGQVILYGPPGTGKTFVAEHLARHLIGGGDGFYEIVQFHPAYAYEDFIQGIRPRARQDGGLDYPVVPGRFLEFCKKAADREDRCVLIVDEINRANLARVFGEMMYLLEYRDKEIPLSSGGSFRIPPNVRIIGTMNTADRSIALVDHALRRRFAFLALYPYYDVLKGFHDKEGTGFPVDGLVHTLIDLNGRIGDRNYEIGVSFFLRKDLKEQIEDIWRMEIEPYLEEVFFDQPAKCEQFKWEKVSGKILG